MIRKTHHEGHEEHEVRNYSFSETFVIFEVKAKGLTRKVPS